MRHRRTNFVMLAHSFKVLARKARIMSKYFTVFNLNPTEYKEYEMERGINPGSYIEYMKHLIKNGEINNYSFITHFNDGFNHFMTINMNRKIEITPI